MFVILCAPPVLVDVGASNRRSKVSFCPAVTPVDIVVAEAVTT